MRKNYLLFALVSLLLISCGDSSRKNVPYYQSDDNKVVSNYPASGEGTFQSPYEIGNGIYKFKGEKYYSISVTRDSCNVLVYGVSDFDTLNDLEFIDDSHSNQIIQTYNYLFEELDQDGYDIIVNSSSYATFGIFSTCISDTYAQDDAYIELTDGQRVTMNKNDELYKFRMTRVGTYTLNTTGTDVQVRIYDSQMNSIYSEFDNKHDKALQAGDYFMLLSKSTKDEVNFVFDIDSL